MRRETEIVTEVQSHPTRILIPSREVSRLETSIRDQRPRMDQTGMQRKETAAKSCLKMFPVRRFRCLRGSGVRIPMFCP
jgi:hypothetical protein